MGILCGKVNGLEIRKKEDLSLLTKRKFKIKRMFLSLFFLKLVRICFQENLF